MIEWAKKELALLSEGGDEGGIQEWANKAILEVVELFADQGHSGTTASYCASIISRLLTSKPITPLTGHDDEWTESFDGFQQNTRYSAVFRENKDNSTAYDISGKLFTGDGGVTWFTNKDSAVPVTFPYNVPLSPEYVYLEGDE